jgi:hypothetical protein
MGYSLLTLKTTTVYIRQVHDLHSNLPDLSGSLSKPDGSRTVGWVEERNPAVHSASVSRDSVYTVRDAADTAAPGAAITAPEADAEFKPGRVGMYSCPPHPLLTRTRQITGFPCEKRGQIYFLMASRTN